MTILAELDSVSYAIGGTDLFDRIDLVINEGDRIGQVGHNGSGKSTLLALVNSALEPDRGEIRFRRTLRVQAVEQFLPPQLESFTAADAVGADRWQAEALLTVLGFSQAGLDYRVGDLSGGQQNRLMFARAVIQEPELLLLDEPTNHLDLATIVVFENYLRSLGSAFVLVSHDRAFLEAVTTRTVFLRDKKLYHFAGGYSAAKQDLDNMDDAAKHALANEERKIEALRTSAKRLTAWQRINGNEKFARRAKSIERRIERMEESKTFVSKGSPLDLSVDAGRSRAKEILRVNDFSVSFSADSPPLFQIDELLIRPGDRVALLGHNGVGKSTFIRLLVGERPDAIRLSPQTSLGYYDQELEEVQTDKSMADFVRDRVDATSVNVRNRLIAAGFSYADHIKSINVLSGGERARVLFVVLSLNRPNFLVLDEPTNHIDIQGKEQLEADLVGNDAAVLLTSHDRQFIESVAQRFLMIEGGTLKEINDPNEFFRSQPTESSAAPTERASTSQHDDVLERIVELEDKLKADKARKPKFQKPKLQAAWQQELDALLKRIE